MRRLTISGSQLAELIGVENPLALVAVIRVSATGWEVLLEEDAMQTTGTCPPLSDNTKRRPPRGGKKGR